MPAKPSCALVAAIDMPCARMPRASLDLHRSCTCTIVVWALPRASIIVSPPSRDWHAVCSCHVPPYTFTALMREPLCCVPWPRNPIIISPPSHLVRRAVGSCHVRLITSPPRSRSTVPCAAATRSHHQPTAVACAPTCRAVPTRFYNLFTAHACASTCRALQPRATYPHRSCV